MKFDKFTLTYFIIRFVRRPPLDMKTTIVLKFNFRSRENTPVKPSFERQLYSSSSIVLVMLQTEFSRNFDFLTALQ